MIARSIDITYPKAFTRDAIGTFRADLKLIPHTGERWMRPMFDLDPAIEPAGAIAALAVFRNRAFEPHQAGVPEQVRTDLALLEVGQENAVHALRQPPGKVGLSHAERQLSDVLAVADQLEDVELNLVIVPARM